MRDPGRPDTLQFASATRADSTRLDDSKLDGARLTAPDEHDSGDVVSGADSLLGNPPTASTACTLGFDDPEALDRLPNAAADSFAYAPFYFEPCGGVFVRLRPQTESHHHLGYENVHHQNCYVAPDFYESCPDEIDPLAEPRKVQMHTASSTLRVTVETSGGGIRPFDLLSFELTEAPVKLCVLEPLETDPGEWEAAFPSDEPPMVWKCWDTLEPGWVWDLSAYAQDVLEVQITGKGYDGGIWSLDDLEVAVNE